MVFGTGLSEWKMAPRKRGNSGNSSNGATLGIERELWQAADTLRGGGKA